MSIDLLILGNAPIERMLERVKLAEAVGYDTVWLADERFYRGVYSCLTPFAGHTSKVLLGPCVTDPFSRHPALTAMAIATLDEVSGGRGIPGIGAGISGFAELGLYRSKPARAIYETIEVIRALLRGESVDFHGAVINLDQGRLSFVPHRSAIPIYVASNGPPRAAGGGSGCRWRHHGGLRLGLRSTGLQRRDYHQRLSGRPRSEKRQKDRSAEHLCRRGRAGGAQGGPSLGRALSRRGAAAVEDH